ncbi:hypothetical protein LCGC14_2039400, partial [marine sediment metagenome]
TWEDVTEECALEWWEEASDGTRGHINIQHDGQRVAIVGHQVNADVGGGFNRRGEYRVTTAPDGKFSGSIKVEHFIPDPEPVIAYKAVIEVDGEWVSTWAGGPCAGDLERLSYAVGRIVTATKGPGVACFTNLESARVAFPSPISKGGNGSIPRNHGRLGILEVQTIGVGAPSPNVFDAESRGAYCYPSVKVLSVAWEEEKKEEWVDVTEECTVRTYNFGALGSWFALEHDGNSVAHLGAETKILARGNYRTTLDDFGKGGPTHAGHIKVEKRND